ncbi:MAG: hypothetical protein M1819_001572 [Sarea resinae]|nr:MAG: hypothetical protein M1819_001572 [Sarea resinae]
MTTISGIEDDPTDFEGTYPPFRSDPDIVRKKPKTNAATGASAAGVRAFSAQLVAFYFRAPVKAFFRTRVDYMAYARAINPDAQQNNKRWSWRLTTPGLLLHAVQTEGWAFIPRQVLPPMVANATVGAILYTAYLQALGHFHPPSSYGVKRIYPPAPFYATFAAGFTAGGVQSLVAAPLDALQVRFSTSDMLESQYTNAWAYARHKLQEIGVRGVFAGWTLSFLKDAFGYAVFFSTFEYVKQQAYYGFVTRYYGSHVPPFTVTGPDPLSRTLTPGPDDAAAAADDDSSSTIHDSTTTTLSPAPRTTSLPTTRPTITPHYALEPTFLLLAGLAASLTQQTISHPLTRLQTLHHTHLESLDFLAHLDTTHPVPSRTRMLQNYYHAYVDTFRAAGVRARRAGGWRAWAYAGFWMNAVRQVPSTGAGLIVFELVRRRAGVSPAEDARIEGDGYDILLA